MMRYLFSLLCLFPFYAALSQDHVADQMERYNQAHPNSSLFVHFDKNVYSNNETIYFTAYLLKTAINSVNSHKILAVDIIRDLDSAIIISDKFVVFSGLALGSIKLSDSITTGDYHIVTYTNVILNHLPELTFSQPITIKTSIQPPFNASMKLMEPPNQHSQTRQVLVSVLTNESRFLPKPVNLSYRYGNIHKSLRTDASGQAVLDLPIKNDLPDPNLYVKLKNGKDSTLISIAVPYGRDKASVKFYPEGGNLILGLATTVGWEVKDQQKMPIALRAYLYKNNMPVDTIETSSSGIGKFKLFVEKGEDYTVKLVHNGLVDSIYRLPEALPTGIILNVAEALPKDTLRFTLKTNGPKNIFIRLHNFRESFIHIPFKMDFNIKSIKIPLNGIPKGLMTITITDEQERPLAERMVFAHYDDIDKFTITTDKSIYAPREKVNLTLSLDGKQEKALVSIAVVQNNRLELKKMNDIEGYNYLKNELAAFPTHLKGLPFKDKVYLEEVLLVKGWRKYSWESLGDVSVRDTIYKPDSLTIGGWITKHQKQLTEPVEVGAFGDERLRLADTNSKGFFNLFDPNFVSVSEKKMYLFVNVRDKDKYQIHINDPFVKMSAQIKNNLTFRDGILPSVLINNAESVLKVNEKSISLKEVLIKGKKDDFYMGSGPNGCGDYVCRYKILNCRNHTAYDQGTTKPLVGVTYAGSNGPYRGCKEPSAGFVKFNGVHIQKEFYINYYKDPQEPAFFSTLFWEYITPLVAGKPTELSFYTSDITGKFRIVVQGITAKDVAYAEQFFEVKR